MLGWSLDACDAKRTLWDAIGRYRMLWDAKGRHGTLLAATTTATDVSTFEFSSRFMYIILVNCFCVMRLISNENLTIIVDGTFMEIRTNFA